MKNFQFIEPAENCAFLVHEAEDSDFALIFPADGQDVEFFEDLVARLGEVAVGQLIARATKRWVAKPEVRGIHGTLYFGYENRKKYFPNKREADLDVAPRGRPPRVV